MAMESEPFSTVNDDNVRSVAGYLMQRKDRFWTAAVVASFLRPDLARELLGCLPAELRERIEKEALGLRDVTDLQVTSIASEVSSFLEKG